MELVPPREDGGREDGGDDAGAGRPPMSAGAQRKCDEDERKRDESRHEPNEWEPEIREVDIRRAKNSEQQDRRGDARRHREQPAKRFAFRRGERLRRLIAPWHEWVKAREERGARARGEHRAGTDGRRRDRIEGQRRAALARDEQSGDDEPLYSDREVRRDTHR